MEEGDGEQTYPSYRTITAGAQAWLVSSTIPTYAGLIFPFFARLMFVHPLLLSFRI